MYEETRRREGGQEGEKGVNEREGCGEIKERRKEGRGGYGGYIAWEWVTWRLP